MSFAHIFQSPHALTRKGASHVWSNSCHTVFEDLKKRLSDAVILAYPSFHQDLTPETDASIRLIGAVLSQVKEDS